MSDILFDLRDVGRRWGSRDVLGGVTLQLKRGERIAVVGPSGGGKSTLLKLLVGRDRPTAGVLSVDGVSLSAMSRSALRQHRRRCAYIEQSGHVLPGLSVYRNVLAGRLSGWPWWQVLLSSLWPIQRDDVAVALSQVGLTERMWEPASILSGGQQQRVAIARVLLWSPKPPLSEGSSSSHQLRALLVDEPTSALDPAWASDMASRLLALQAASGATLVWCTHGLSLIQDDVDRVLGISAGRLAFDLAPEEVTSALLQSLYAGTDESAH